MKTALITGVSGYLGTHLTKKLKNEGWKIVGLDIKRTKNKYLDLFVECDIRDLKNLDLIFKKIKIDVVFHLAGKIEVEESTKYPNLFFETNVNGTVNVLNKMEKYGVNCIVYSSTAGIYATSDKPIKESDSVNPMNNPYSASKYSAELAIKCSKVKHIIFRYFNLAGADSDGEFGENHEPETHLIPRIFRNINNFTIYGSNYNTIDGTCVRDFVHVDDVCDVHIKGAEMVLSGEIESGTFNIGSGQGHSVLEIVNKIKDNLNLEIKYNITSNRTGDPASLVADVESAKTKINFETKHNIENIIRTAYDWERKKLQHENR